MSLSSGAVCSFDVLVDLEALPARGGWCEVGVSGSLRSRRVLHRGLYWRGVLVDASTDGVPNTHVWTLTSEVDAASAHLVIAATTDSHGVPDRARELVATCHGIDHGTFQVEPDTHAGRDQITW